MPKEKAKEYTHAEKQKALDEAHEFMKSDAERLADIKKYVASSFKRNINPILNESELEFLIRRAEMGLGVEIDE